MAKNGDKATIRELYTVAQSLETKIDDLKACSVSKKDFEELVKDVKSLQNWKWKVTGMAGGVGAVFAYFMDKFMGGK